MEYTGINLYKIEKITGLSFQNSIRLHFDSITLFENESYPSAFFLSVLSLEEFGKVFLLADFLYHSRVDGRMEKEWEEKYIQRIFSHRDKQNSFTYHSQFNLPKSFINKVYNGNIEIKKQNSVYVGLKKIKRKIDLKSKITNPFKIDKEKAKNQITIVNDCFLEIILGKIKGQYIIDSDVVENLMDNSLYSSIRSKWEYTTPKVKRRLEKLEQLSDFIDQ